MAAAQAAGPGLVPPGVRWEWSWSGWARPTPVDEPETIRAVGGSSIVTLVGQPSELMLYAHGRTVGRGDQAGRRARDDRDLQRGRLSTSDAGLARFGRDWASDEGSL